MTPTSAGPELPLRGDGVGDVRFGATEAEALAAVASVVGPPLTQAGGPDPSAVATRLHNGCGNLTDRVLFFDRGLVLGFADGRLASWSIASTSFERTDDGRILQRGSDLATASGLRLGMALTEVAERYGDRFTAVNESVLAAGIPYVDAVVDDGGPVLVLAWHDQGPPTMPGVEGRLVQLTAGVGCFPDRRVTVGDRPIGAALRTGGGDPYDRVLTADGVHTEWGTLWAGCIGTADPCRRLVHLMWRADDATRAIVAVWSTVAADRADAVLRTVVDVLPVVAGTRPIDPEGCRAADPGRALLRLAVPGDGTVVLDVDDATGAFVRREVSTDGC